MAAASALNTIAFGPFEAACILMARGHGVKGVDSPPPSRRTHSSLRYSDALSDGLHPLDMGK